MQPTRFQQAAALELARRLSRGPAPVVGGVAEAHRKEPSPARILPAAGLAQLAQGLVRAVLDLAGGRPNPEQLRETIEREVKKALAGQPGLNRALASRVLSQAPFLLDLSRLADLAKGATPLSPLAAALAGRRDELVVGPSLAFRRLLKDLDSVAATDFAVLLTGESGTGKEMLARRLHRLSPRQDGPFVAVNCAAIPAALLESQLFGHRKGAFSGAEANHPGFVAAADGGALFLDEIGESTPDFQVKLLRVLQERAVVPVGEVAPRPVDFRLICASHRDLVLAAEQGGFNPSLLYRVMEVPFCLPPLRERPEDVPALADHFLTQACLIAKRSRELSPQVVERLAAFHWPGNARQLANVIKTMVAKSREYLIGLADLPPELSRPAPGLEEAYLARLKGVDGLPAIRLAGLARLLAANRGGELANRQVRDELAVSDTTAKKLLLALAEAGLLRLVGNRGGRRYQVVEAG